MLTKQILRVLNNMRINRSVSMCIQSAVYLNLSLKANSRKAPLHEEAFCMVESRGPLCCSEYSQIWCGPCSLCLHNYTKAVLKLVFYLLFQYPFEENMFQSLFHPLQTKFLDTVNTLCGRIPQVFLKQIEKTMKAVYEKKVVRHVRLPHEKWASAAFQVSTS